MESLQKTPTIKVIGELKWFLDLHVIRCGGKKLRLIFFGLVHGQILGYKTCKIKNWAIEHKVKV